jgi:twitching motility protein PilT
MGTPSTAHRTPLQTILSRAVASDASDVHLKDAAHPVMRINGQLTMMADCPLLDAAALESYARELLEGSPAKGDAYSSDGDVDLSFARPGLGRFRVNVFRQRGVVSIVMRVVRTDIRSLPELGMPGVVTELAEQERGIILVTGTTGCGKSTTLAGMIDHINRVTHKHVVTIEDPIEALHTDRQSLISQREVGLDTPSFAQALRHLLRQDPDVIMIGEIRDEATMEVALSAAQTGHLVLSTMHTLDAIETVNRAIGFFPPHRQASVRTMLAGTLRGVVSQRLVPAADGASRVVAAEVLVVTARARDLLAGTEDPSGLRDVISEGDYYGMQTFDQSLFRHVTSGRVRVEDAMAHANSPHDFGLMLSAGNAHREDTFYASEPEPSTLESNEAMPSGRNGPDRVGQVDDGAATGSRVGSSALF